MARIRFRISLLAAAVALALLLSSSVPASAATNFTLSDLKLKHLLADVGASAAIAATGTIDRDLYALGPRLNVRPTFAIRQSCGSASAPGSAVVVSESLEGRTIAAHVTSQVVSSPHAKLLRWSAAISLDPATDFFGQFYSIDPVAWSICPAGLLPVSQASVMSVRVLIWPGFGGFSPVTTRSGENLVIDFTVAAGHTEY